jgi:hypothetical protein
MVAARDDDPVPRVLEALRQQYAGSDVDLVVVDASPSGAFAGLAGERRPTVTVARADTDARRASLLNLAWRTATGREVAFLSPCLTPATMWVDAVSSALSRGRRLVSASVLPSAETVGDSGPLSYLLWANRYEVPVVSADQMACLRADLEAVGGWNEDIDDDLADVDLATRLVDSGVEPKWARHAVAYYDVTAVDLATLVEQRREPMRSAAVLGQHPRARARLLLGGLFGHRRQAEAVLAVAGILLCGRNRRAALLAMPWLHERLCLTPAAGGNRRRWLVLPGVLAFDLYDATLATAARMRSPREH